MRYIIIKKDWEVRNFGSNEYDRILEFHYELVSKSIGYYSDGYTRRFLEECKVKLPTLRLGAAQMAAAKTSGGGQANFYSYAHHAVCVLFGNAVMAILDPIKKRLDDEQSEIQMIPDANERFHPQEWLDYNLEHYETGVVMGGGEIVADAPRAVITYQENYIRKKDTGRYDLILQPPFIPPTQILFSAENLNGVDFTASL